MVVVPSQPSRQQPVPTGLSRPYGWSEVLAMKAHYGVHIDPLAEPATVEAAVIQRLYATWGNGAAAWPLDQLLYAVRAEYRHLNRAQRAAKLPGLVLAALNDPHGGLEIVRRRYVAA